jgi:hypothetical protein
MNDSDTHDDAAILARIREELQRSLREATLPPIAPRDEPTAEHPSANDVEQELTALRAAADIRDVGTSSYRRLVGGLVAVVRRLADKALAPTLERQVAYNTANRRVVEALRVEIESLKAELQATQRDCDRLRTKLGTSGTQE